MERIEKFDTFNESSDDKFTLLKDIGNLRKGKKFDSFGGLVSAINVIVDGKEKTIRFDDKEWFK